MVKGSGDKKTNIQYLKRMDEQISVLCRQKKYGHALKLAEQAHKLAKATFGPGHTVVNAYSTNVDALKRVLSERMGAEKTEESPTTGDSSNTADKAGFFEGVNWKIASRFAVLTLVLAILFTVLFHNVTQPVSNNSEPAYASTDQMVEKAPLYRVKATFIPERRFIEGEEEVSFNNPVQRKEFLFNLYFNRYRDKTLAASEMRKYAYKTGADQGYIDILWVSMGSKRLPFRQEGQMLRITHNAGVFPPGQSTVKIGFRVKVPYILDRSGGDKDGIWLGNWLPTLSVDGMSHQTEIGDPFVNLSSNYETEFTVPKAYRLVLSNIYSVQDSGNNRIYKSRLQLVRDLPVFINRSYREAVVNDGETEIHYYYRDADSRPVEVLDIAKKALFYYKNYVGAYPWKQLNIVENDMYLNGMEYSTLVLLSSKVIHKNMEETVFHEVGHQWFYNIVGNDQYRAAFIDEGLVEFLTCLQLKRQEPQYYGVLPGLSRNLADFGTWQDYREIHYRNGRKLYESVYVLLGKNEFEKFIKEYYHKYRFSLVSSGEFKKFLSEKIGEQKTRTLLP